MAWLDDLLGKNILQAGSLLPQRKNLNFVSGATVADNNATGATDITITAAAGVGSFSGTNPNSATAGTRGDVLRNTGAWNGFEFWVCIASGTPGTWVPTGRGGQFITTAATRQSLATDRAIIVTSTASARLITLPDTSTIAVGFDLPVTDGSFSATGNDTVVNTYFSATNINGSLSIPIPADGNGNSFTFIWNGTSWNVW